MPLTKRVPVLFSPEEYNRLKGLSKKMKKPVGTYIREVVEGSFTSEERKVRISAFARKKAIELDIPENEAMEAFLMEWRKQELLRSEGRIDLDIDLGKLRADRDLNR